MGRRGHRGRHGHRGPGALGTAPERPGDRGRAAGLPPGAPPADGPVDIGDATPSEARPAGELATFASTRVGDPPPAAAPGSAPAPADASAPPRQGDGAPRNGATLPQLRRFIKSRPYIPMHELRRRFGLDCDTDEVYAVGAGSPPLFVGLPEREAGFLGELIRSGEIGYELLLDPSCPLVVGVYSMRPVGRA